MAPTALQAGDRVSINAGIYRKYKKGSYAKPYGTKMATILVDGNTEERNVRLSSIKKIQSRSTPGADADVVTIKRTDYLHLKSEIASLTMQLQLLNVRVNELME